MSMRASRKLESRKYKVKNLPLADFCRHRLFVVLSTFYSLTFYLITSFKTRFKSSFKTSYY